MNSVLCTLLVAFLSSPLAFSQQIAKQPLIPVDNLSLPSFLGRWFPMYTSQLVIDTSFKNVFCPVTDYSLSNGASLASFVPSNLVAIDSMCSFNLDSLSGRLIQKEGMLVNNLFQSIPGKFLVIVDGLLTELLVLAVGDIQSSSATTPVVTPMDNKKKPHRHPTDLTSSNLRPQDPIVPGSGAGSSILPNPSGSGPDTLANMYPWAILSDSTGSMLFIVARDISTFSAQYEQIALQKVQSLGFTSADAKPVKINQDPNCQYAAAPVMM